MGLALGWPRKEALVTILVLLAALHAAPAASVTPSDELRALVTRARGGDVRGAVAAFLPWPPERLVAAAESTTLEGADRRAAVLLYTELSSLQMFVADKKVRKVGRDLALRLATRLDDPAFERRRALALGYWHQQWGHLEDARGYFKEHEDDAEALVAQGAVYEQIDTMGRGWGRFGDTRQPLESAAAFYERALEARPDYDEAYLRLARVRQRQRRTEIARQTFTDLLSRRPRPDIAGYAHLFLGEMAQKEGRLEAALEHYRLAVTADPRLQPAHLSLSQALHQAGRVKESAQAMLAGLRATADTGVHGWYGYFAVALHGYRRTMDALWSEVRQ
jgi:tetratricopeptide (TPR) repeat protein